MKAIPIMLALLLIFCSIATAETKNTNNADYFCEWLNDYDVLDHKHNYTDRYNDCERENPMGLGLDVIVYEAGGTIQRWGLDAVEVQQKYDFPNQEYSLYGVVKCNIWKPLKNMFK